jgi:RND family efflux transporter MFP subunit
MKRCNSAILNFSVLIAIFSGGLAGCSGERRPEPSATETVSGVAVIVAQKTTVPDWLEAVGTVRAAQTSQVASQMMGNILEIRVREGDRVQAGQILATLDDSQPRAAVEQAAAAVTAAQKEVSSAEANFALAEATFRRYQQLFDRKSVSPQEFDEIKARYQSAEARRDMARAALAQAEAALAQSRTSLGYSKIHAPFSGVVTQKKADTGTLAAPGMPIFTIEDTRSFRLEATVDEGDIRIVRVGEMAPVFLDALGGTELSGKVVQIVPAADPASRSFLVKIELPADARLHSGLFGRAKFTRGEQSAILIPQAAVVTRGQLQGIFVLDANGIAGLRYVTLGKSVAEQVEVLSGLQEGEKLIAAPENREFSGKRISARS